MLLNLFILLGLSLLISDSTSVSSEKELIILHTNDLHSSLQGSAPESNYTPLIQDNDGTLGGFARLSTIIQTEKNKHDNVLALDGGDFLMGTLFQTLEMETGFQLKLMYDMGYDAVCIGNHEFDFGIENLSSYLLKASEDSIPALLLSNVTCSPKLTSDDSFEKIMQDGIIKPYYITHTKDFKIGIFGLLGNEAYDVANAHELQLENQVKTARSIVKHLRQNEEVDIVIALSHSGVFYDNDGEVIRSEDVKLAHKVDGIDLIISGHTHTIIEKPLHINNTYIVQAGDRGKKIGKLRLKVGDDVSIKDYQLIPVNDDIEGDKIIQNKILKQKELLTQQTLKSLPYTYDEPLFHLNFDLNYDNEAPENCNIGSFTADAMHYYSNKYADEYCNIAIIGHGMLRASLPKGNVYLPEVFNVASLGSGKDNIPGYPMARIYLTAREIERLMGLLIKASHQSVNYYMFSSGLQVDYSRKGKDYDKIERIRIQNSEGLFETVDPSRSNKQLYSVVADAYMISFLAKIKKMTFGLINIEAKDKDGNTFENLDRAIIDFDPNIAGVQEGKIWISLIEYASSFKDEAENLIPEIPYEYEEQALRLQAIN